MKSKDEKGLEVLYDQYADSLHGIIYRILDQQQAAEEILQQTFMKIWNNIDSYDPSKSTLFTWMAAIARNSAIDLKRLKKYQHAAKTKTLDASVYEIEGQAINNANVDVEKLTAKLEEKYKIVLDYMYLRGYSQAEIAEELDIPLGTIKTRLRKAILILRNELKSEKKLFLGLLLFLILLIIIL